MPAVRNGAVQAACFPSIKVCLASDVIPVFGPGEGKLHADHTCLDMPTWKQTGHGFLEITLTVHSWAVMDSLVTASQGEQTAGKRCDWACKPKTELSGCFTRRVIAGAGSDWIPGMVRQRREKLCQLECVYIFCFLHLKLKILLITNALFLKVVVG